MFQTWLESRPGGRGPACREGWEEKLKQNVGSTSEETDTCTTDKRTHVIWFWLRHESLFLPPKRLKSGKRRFKIGT